MKTKELRQKTKKELESALEADRTKLGKLGFDLNNKKLKNVCEVRQTRREIAQILTVLKEK